MRSSHESPRVRVSRVRASGVARLGRAWGRLFDPPADSAALRAYLGDSRNLFLVATAGSRAVGFLRATRLGQLHTRRPQLFIYEIGVVPGFRRRGVGTALIRNVLAYCGRNRFEEAFVLTDPGNRAAVGLYRATGAITETRGDRMFVYRIRRRPRNGRTSTHRNGADSRRST